MRALYSNDDILFSFQRLNPPPEEPEEEPEDAKKKGKGDKGGKDAKKDKGKGKKGKGGDEDEGEDKLTTGSLMGPTAIVNHMLESVSKYKGVWSVLDEKENFHQRHSVDIAKDMIRPIVKEKIRKEVDMRLLLYLDNIKLQVAQRQAAAGMHY